MSIYVPRSVIEMITSMDKKGILFNPSVCVRFERKGYEISLSLDSSLGKGDLRRGEFRVYKDDEDVTNQFLSLFGSDANLINGSVDNLLTIIKHIDSNE